MKYLKIDLAMLFELSSCKKEDTLPKLSFSQQERAWFIYQVGQKFEFKTASGESMTFLVDSVKNYFSTEYKDPFTSPIAIDEAETYVAHLSANNDFINIAFYKSSLYNSTANKLNQTILWRNVIGQFVEIESIKNQTPLISRVINGVTYKNVSAAIPISDTKYSWTKWKSGYYDQTAGFVELIDGNGVSWTRQ